jgi:hypothetical protein
MVDSSEMIFSISWRLNLEQIHTTNLDILDILIGLAPALLSFNVKIYNKKRGEARPKCKKY